MPLHRKHASSDDEEEQEKALLTSSIGQQVFSAGVPTEFTVTTAARDDAGELVRGFFTLSDGEAIEKLEYLEPRDGQWYELEGAFGPEGGFPVADATSRFRVTFRKAGSFDLRIQLRRVADDAVVCAAEEKAERRRRPTGADTTAAERERTTGSPIAGATGMADMAVEQRTWRRYRERWRR